MENNSLNFYSTAILKINDGVDIDEALNEIKQLEIATNKEDGNLIFTVLKQKDATDKLIIWESFINKEAFNQHLASEHIQSFAAKNYFTIESIFEGELI